MDTEHAQSTNTADEADKLRLRLRIYQEHEIAFGPGKADLLEEIQKTGSISQAAKQLNMSYRRAWLLVDTMNRCFSEPLVTTQTGGNHGGGAQVSAMGLNVLRLFREMEHTAVAAVMPQYGQLTALMQQAETSSTD